MGKLKTPAWIKEGYGSKAEWEEDQVGKDADSSEEDTSKKKFKVRRCPKCESDNVRVVVEKEAKGDWECVACGWSGKKPNIELLGEDEFMKYLDDKGEEVA